VIGRDAIGGGVKMGSGDDSGSADGDDLDGGEVSCTTGIYGGSASSVTAMESWGWLLIRQTH